MQIPGLYSNNFCNTLECGLVYSKSEDVFRNLPTLKRYRLIWTVGSKSCASDQTRVFMKRYAISTIRSPINGSDLIWPRSTRIRSIANKWLGFNYAKGYPASIFSRPSPIRRLAQLLFLIDWPTGGVEHTTAGHRRRVPNPVPTTFNSRFPSAKRRRDSSELGRGLLTALEAGLNASYNERCFAAVCSRDAKFPMVLVAPTPSDVHRSFVVISRTHLDWIPECRSMEAGMNRRCDSCFIRAHRSAVAHAISASATKRPDDKQWWYLDGMQRRGHGRLI
jgi:hypothetical protein